MNYFQSKKILITGTTGLLGTNLYNRLSNMHVDTRRVYNERRPRPMIGDFICGDLRDANICNAATKDIDIVIHCAASTSGAAVMSKTPLIHVTPNLIMTANLLEAAFNNKVKKFIFFASTTGYPQINRPVIEEDMFSGDPFDKYFSVGWTKRSLEKLCQIYDRLGMPCIVLRPSNIYGPCFSGDTEVLTINGIQNIKDIKENDVVYTLNPNTFEVEPSRVIATQINKTDEIFNFISKSVDFKITPDHKLFCKTTAGFVKRRADYFRKMAGKKRGQLTFAMHKKYSKINTTNPLFDFSQFIDKEHLKLPNNQVKDSYSHRSKPYDIVYKTQDLAAFIGWYVSEGSIIDSEECKQIRITQIINIDYVNEIKTLLTNMNISFGQDANGFYFTSRLWSNFIKQFIKKGASNKKLPAFVFSWDKKYLQIIFECLMKGDGNSSGRRYTTKSTELMKDFLHLCFLLGIKTGNVNHDGVCWRISLRTKQPNTTIKYKDISINKLQETTYCITTEHNHIIYAGRNNKLNWIGQCDKFDPERSHVLPSLIRKAVQKQNPFEIWGDGKDERDLIYVDEMVDAVLLAAEKMDRYDPINIGCGKVVSVNQIAEMIFAASNFKPTIKYIEGPQMIPKREIVVEKAKKLLGFETKISLETGIKLTVDWYKRYVH